LLNNAKDEAFESDKKAKSLQKKVNDHEKALENQAEAAKKAEAERLIMKLAADEEIKKLRLAASLAEAKEAQAKELLAVQEQENKMIKSALAQTASGPMNVTNNFNIGNIGNLVNNPGPGLNLGNNTFNFGK